MKVEKTLASMTKYPRIRSSEPKEEEGTGQENFHKRCGLNYAASESEGSGDEDGFSDEGDSGDEGSSGDEDDSDEDPCVGMTTWEYAMPKISSSSPRGVQLNMGVGEDVRFSDLGGMEKAQEELERFVMLPFCHPEHARLLGVKPVSGVLLHEPPGCGKTKLAHAIANELGIPFHKVSASKLVSCVIDENARLQILTLLTRNLRAQGGSFDLLKIAKSTAGFVGADLTALVNRASTIGLERIVNSMNAADVPIHSKTPKCNQDSGPQKLAVLAMADFEDAVKAIQPSLKREGFAAIPNVKWEDVGGLDSLREDLYRRIKYPDLYKNFGLDLETDFCTTGLQDAAKP